MTGRVWRRRIALAGLLSACFAAVFIGAMSRGDVARMTFGDGELHRAVASNLAADGSNVPEALAGSGPALRYGRIGLPVVLWVLSGGQEAAMAYVQPIIMVLCAAGIAMTTVALLRPPSAIYALAPFVAAGLTASLAGGFSEPLAVLLAMLGVLLAEREHRWLAAAALAGALFTRENAVVVIVGIVAWSALHRRFRDAGAIAASVVPVALWHMIVDHRFGHLPLRDPWLIDTGALGVPFIAVGRAVGSLTGSELVVLVLHLVLALAAIALWRRSASGAVAAVSALAVVSVGEFSWRYIGDAARLAVFLEVFFVLVLTKARLESDHKMRRPPPQDPEPVRVPAGHEAAR